MLKPLESYTSNEIAMEMSKNPFGKSKFTKEELQFIEKEMNTTIEFCCGMLVKGDDKALEYDLKMAQQVIEKVRMS